MSVFPAKDVPALLKKHESDITALHSAVNKIIAILEANGLTTTGPVNAASVTATGNVAGNTLQSTGNGGQKFTLTIGSDASGPYINISGPY